MTNDAFLDEAVSFAKKRLLEAGSFTTMIIGQTITGEKLAFMGDYIDDREKEHFLRFVTISFLAKNVYRYVVVSEALMTPPITDEEKKDLGTWFERSRIECLIAISVSPTQNYGVVFEIKRNKEGSIKSVDYLKTIKKVEGRFTELLPRKQVSVPKEMASMIDSFFTQHGRYLN